MELSLGGFLPGDVAGGEFVVVEFSVGGAVGLQVEFDVGAALQNAVPGLSKVLGKAGKESDK